MKDKSQVTEILIQPDGRVFVFGMSRPVLEVLGSLQPEDPRLKTLVQVVNSTDFKGTTNNHDSRGRESIGHG
jgi:hypothetical protein